MARPVEERITRETAGRTALALIDEVGLDAFTLPKLAARLGVTTPALYHHFADRNELLSAVAEQMLDGADRPPTPADPQEWRGWLVACSLNLRIAVLEHRRAAPVLLQFPPRLFVAEWFDAAAEVLFQADVPAADVIQILDGIEVLSIGAILNEATRTRTDGEPVFPGGDTSHPFLARALDANHFDDVQLYSARIEKFLDGVLPESERERLSRRS